MEEQFKHELWQQQSQKTISKIRSISGDIQILERDIKKGNILSSLIGIVSGVMTIAGIHGAPFTFFCGPLDLAALGTVIGIYIGVQGIVRTLVRSSK
jgi:hypothetical protein